MSVINFDSVDHLSLADGIPIEQCRLCGTIVLRQCQHLHRSSTSNSRPRAKVMRSSVSDYSYQLS
jgi:hypothetical protein